MDPTANLEEQRELAESLLAAIEAEEELDEDDVYRLCELVQAQDGWLSKGGFLPAPWAKGR